MVSRLDGAVTKLAKHCHCSRPMAHALRNDPPFILENMTLPLTTGRVHTWHMQFKEFKASYANSYEYCLDKPKEKEELVHWLWAHRWQEPVALQRYFGKAFVDRTLAKPFKCSPAMLKDFTCRCHPERNLNKK